MRGRRRLRRRVEVYIRGSKTLSAYKAAFSGGWGLYLGLGVCIWVGTMIYILDGKKIQFSEARSGIAI
jgi:hypothetical protein